MSTQFKAKDNPRVIAIQKIYGKFYNKDENLTIGKHRFKKFIKDVVNGTRQLGITEVDNAHIAMPELRSTYASHT